MRHPLAATVLLLTTFTAASCDDGTLDLSNAGGNASGASAGVPASPGGEPGSAGGAGAGGPSVEAEGGSTGAAGASTAEGGGAGDGGGSHGGAPEVDASAGAGGEGTHAAQLGCTEELCGPDFCEGAIGECTFEGGELNCTGEVGTTAMVVARQDFHVVKIDMAGATELRMAARICDPSGYVLHLGDSSTNDGGGGDVGRTSNDAEILIQDTRLDVFANDLGAQGGVHPSLMNDAKYVNETGCTTRALIVGDQLVRDAHVPGFSLESSFLLRVDPAGDLEGMPDALWWLGINHVARAQINRSGTGVEKLRLCFTQQLPQRCALDGYGRDPDAGLCASSPAGWEGCGAHGCAICPDMLADYPNYLKNHPCCRPALSCSGPPTACHQSCPAPSDADR